MSAETLAAAADLILEDHPPCACGYSACPTTFYEAVALLLHNEANAQHASPDDGPYRYNAARLQILTEIASAYTNLAGG